MADWLLYTTIGIAVVFVIFMSVLILRGKIVLGSVEIGWPPKITFVPKGGSGAGGTADVISAEGKGKIGNVNIEGAAPSFSATAKDEGQVGDISIKRKM